LIALDSHVETPAVDADYALVVRGGTGQLGNLPQFGAFDLFGQGCPGSVPAPSFCAQLNPTGGTLLTTNAAREYAYTVPSLGNLQVVSFDIFTSSTTGATQVVPAHIYSNAGSLPAPIPLASTTITVGPTAGFYTATFPAPVTVSGTFYIAMDSSAQTVRRSNLSAGATGTAFARVPPTGTWTLSGAVTRPSYSVTCAGGGQFKVPALDGAGVPTIQAPYEVTLQDAVGNSLAVLVSGISDAFLGITPLPIVLPGAPGCELLVSNELLSPVITSSGGEAGFTLLVPNNPALLNALIFHQWAVFDAVNPLGIVVSNAGRARIGN
jgi:hypothetical protein